MEEKVTSINKMTKRGTKREIFDFNWIEDFAMRKNKHRDFMEAKIKLDAGTSYGKLDDIEGNLRKPLLECSKSK